MVPSAQYAGASDSCNPSMGFANFSTPSRIGQERLEAIIGAIVRCFASFRPPSRRADALPDRPIRVYDTGRPVTSGQLIVRPPAAGLARGEPRLTEHLIGQLGYLGIALILILGGLGLPIPEEAPIILAAVLSKNGGLHWPLALASCLVGVLLGDMVVYLLGFFYGEKVLSLPLTRRLLTRQREAQIKGYFHRHGFKILVSGRFVPGFRTAAYLTAGILKLPPLKLLVTDIVAASLTTFLMFGLGYAFAHQIQSGIREVQQWVTVILALSLAIWLLARYDRARRRSGLPVGPPVLDSDDVPLPSGDYRAPLSSPETAAAPELAIIKGAVATEPRVEVAADPAPGVWTVAAGSTTRASTAIPARDSHDPVMIDLEAGQPHSSIESPLR
jgi:membrane protein DedA with SNARE-associated domain